MAYVDYSYYTNTYLGNLIKEADFSRLAERASRALDVITFDRLVESVPTDVASKVKNCTCKIAETMADLERAENAMRASVGSVETADGSVKGKTIKSVSAGGESVTYDNGTSMYANIAFNEMAKEALYLNVARVYLANTGLLYAGV